MMQPVQLVNVVLLELTQLTSDPLTIYLTNEFQIPKLDLLSFGNLVPEELKVVQKLPDQSTATSFTTNHTCDRLCTNSRYVCPDKTIKNKILGDSNIKLWDRMSRAENVSRITYSRHQNETKELKSYFCINCGGGETGSMYVQS